MRGAYHPHELTAHQASLAFEEGQGIPRGASSPLSRPSLSISPDVEPPVWLEKKESDKTYNQCVGVLIRAVKEDVKRCSGSMSVKKQGWFGGLLGGSKNNAAAGTESPPGIGVLFGTHNWDSCALILKELVGNGLAVEDSEQAPIRVGEEAAERVAIGQLYGEFLLSRISARKVAQEFQLILFIRNER